MLISTRVSNAVPAALIIHLINLLAVVSLVHQTQDLYTVSPLHSCWQPSHCVIGLSGPTEGKGVESGWVAE